MNIVRWEPFREMEDLWTRFDRIWPRSLTRSMPSWTGGAPAITGSELEWIPAVNITETDKAFQIEAELPEVDKKDVKIEVQNGHLSISGERKREKEEKGEKTHRIERYYGRFSRTFALPENVDADKAKADCKDGVLRIHLPKKAQEAGPKPKQITVE